MSSTPIIPKIDAVAYLRTAVPAAWGSLLALLAAQIPAIAGLFALVDTQFGESWRKITEALATAAVIFGYYWLARQIGRRWPAAEKWLIGSSSQPVYVTQEVAAEIAPTSEIAVVPEGAVVVTPNAASAIGVGYLKQMNQLNPNESEAK